MRSDGSSSPQLCRLLLTDGVQACSKTPAFLNESGGSEWELWADPVTVSLASGRAGDGLSEPANEVSRRHRACGRGGQPCETGPLSVTA